MALVNADRVKETTTTTGTGTLTLGGAVAGFQSFSAVGNANTAYCCCYAVDANGVSTGEWETFLGTYTASGTTLARTTLIASSTGSAINFSAGTKHVIVCLPSQGMMVNRSVGGTAGTHEVQIEHNGTDGFIRCKSGKLYVVDPAGVSQIVIYSDGSMIDLGQGSVLIKRDTNRRCVLSSNSYQFSSATGDWGLTRAGATTAKISDGSTGSGWLSVAGVARLATDVTRTTTTPSSASDLSVSLIAGRKYVGRLVLFVSCPTAADGLLLDFDGGTATMTSFQSAVTANVQGATLGVTVSSAIATDLTATALNGTAVNCIQVDLAFVCNAAGTFIPRIAKNADAASATLTVATNSFLELKDSA